MKILVREVDILRKVNHPNIIKLVDVYEDDINLHLVRRNKFEHFLFICASYYYYCILVLFLLRLSAF